MLLLLSSQSLFCSKRSTTRDRTLKTTPAIKAGLTDRIRAIQDLANLPDLMDGGLAA
jgi:hypothetical protein